MPPAPLGRSCLISVSRKRTPCSRAKRADWANSCSGGGEERVHGRSGVHRGCGVGACGAARGKSVGRSKMPLHLPALSAAVAAAALATHERNTMVLIMVG